MKKINPQNFLFSDLPEKVAKIEWQTVNVDKSNDLRGDGMEIITPADIVDIYARLKVLLGIKPSGRADTLTEASNLIDEIYKKGDIEEEQNRNAVYKLHSN